MIDKKLKRYLDRYFLFKVIAIIFGIGCIIGIFLLLGTVGTSDYEEEIGEILHSTGWYLLHIILYLILTIITGYFASVANKISGRYAYLLCKVRGGKSNG